MSANTESLMSALTRLRRLSAEINEVVDTINNLFEQLDAIKEVDNCRLKTKHPQWLSHIRAQIEMSASEEVDLLQDHLKLLSVIILCAENVMEAAKPLSMSFASDLSMLYAHLRNVLDYYANAIQSMSSSPMHIPLRKRSLFEETNELHAAISRLKSDLKFLQ
jgi:ElaB/YqjD/DUF883 family membrane-anchored ribosome-binding protein